MNSTRAFQEQASAFRAAAVRAGGQAVVPTCPGWDVGKLVRHLARVYAMVIEGLRLRPADAPPRPARPPEEFDAALSAWDERLGELISALSEIDGDRPVWSFFNGATPRAWNRRMLHETAIHRLDVQHAIGQPEELVFEPELAADGVDEMLTVMVPATDWSTSDYQGRVLYHAADAGQTWLVTYRRGHVPEVGSTPDSGLHKSDVDSTVAGTADALYRYVWGRPSAALIDGDATLAGIVAGR